MKKILRKGQVSLEYLMTYGIAIAIVVIAIAALYSMGVFSGTTTTVPPCSNCFGEFAYSAHTMSGSDFKLELKNGPTSLSSVSCTATNAASCDVASQVDPNSVFVITVVNITDTSADSAIALTYTKAGSTLPMTRTQTISSSYFS
ncbi:MAG TPA: hypothetical protein EYP80_01615 [Candidatus Aenigmarchaeota archaeon]|nr:hypothetical protein [Candidatus Aenigmarchaeota archaeon]